MKAMTHFREIEGRSKGYYGLLVLLLFGIGLGLVAAALKGTYGHHITGMNNHVVWGLPHVFAIFLIVAASGALNVASIASVFGRKAYKPLAPLSGLLAITLLAGGLAVLVLDLGRPDRLIVAMTHYNFKSIFAWNIFLYTGFIAIVAVYLWFMMERRMNPHSTKVGYVAFIWRLILTTGTGSIFGFLVAREAYDAAILAPLFIALSFSLGLAVFLLVLMAAYNWTGRPLGDAILRRLKNLLGIFVAGVLYFVAVYHLTNLYATRLHGVEAFLLVHGGIYPFLFWFVQIALGSVLPLVLLFHPVWSRCRAVIAAACGLVILGGLAQLYVTIIGGQAYPLDLFPGHDVSSSFFDGVVVPYTPSAVEWMLGIGGVALALFMVTVAIKFLRFLPESLADDKVDPHHAAQAAAGAEPAKA
ncbi:Polysulphide reductase NrfD [Thioalkalivibrio sulfidiphilus HL-EbGr7]|uniref:Polysulphide reductase NrfD n=1 Tax=Thioalkalivibrio sulfidiphilus (strain HL-EbGR7) TaxID=396588 RepID=B8GUF6_THISH|nr:NrfD/PsrC family molybdoenzyme membrane anchor subunit [Thioalkalivibrio sulfidiphilus]ACL73276.1 Polysulphide reductase NrfD [Thioalkalivibrio sulfidiphilus HL-EbGr7]